jgi:hypothetical protein
MRFKNMRVYYKEYALLEYTHLSSILLFVVYYSLSERTTSSERTTKKKEKKRMRAAHRRDALQDARIQSMREA